MRHVWIFVLFLCCAIPALTQDTPRAEVFFGYSYLNADLNDLGPRQSANGGNFSFVANMNQWVGAETNFSAYYKRKSIDGVNVYLRDFALTFGPRLHYKWAFAHALFGIDDLGGSALGVSATTSSFASALGGGALFKFSKYVGLEGSGDYVLSRHNLFGGPPFTQNNFRVSAGVVFTFGHTTGTIASPPIQQRQPASRAGARSEGMQVPSLGVAVEPRPNNDGAQITDVAPNGVAALAGLHLGDVINAVNGSQIKTPIELATALSGLASGSTVRVGYLLHGQWQSETNVIIGGH